MVMGREVGRKYSGKSFKLEHSLVADVLLSQQIMKRTVMLYFKGVLACDDIKFTWFDDISVTRPVNHMYCSVNRVKV